MLGGGGWGRDAGDAEAAEVAADEVDGSADAGPGSDDIDGELDDDAGMACRKSGERYSITIGMWEQRQWCERGYGY